VFFGMAAGDPDPVDPRLLMDRSLTLAGGDLWNVLTTAQARQQRADRLFAAVRAGHLALAIAARFPLRDGAQAHALLESRGSVGKVLLVPCSARSCPYCHAGAAWAATNRSRHHGAHPWTVRQPA
jgi:NADPH2:quinone reductase